MDKRIVIVTMASVMLLAGCTVEKKDSVQETGVELGSEVVENGDDVSNAEIDNGKEKNSEVKIVEGKYNKDVFSGKADWGYTTSVFQKESFCFFDKDKSSIKISCEKSGIYKYDLDEANKLHESNEDVGMKYLSGDLTDEEKFEYDHYGSTLISEDKNCSNLYLFDDTIFYLDEDGKIITCNLSTGKKECIEQLKNFKVIYMNVANEKSIYFVADGKEYQYIIGDDYVTCLKKVEDTFIGACQTEYGILYMLNNGNESSDLYLDNIKIFENIVNDTSYIKNDEIHCYKDDKKFNYDW
nr:hypothetical protein [Lachnospiraceae bacterium]